MPPKPTQQLPPQPTTTDAARFEEPISRTKPSRGNQTVHRFEARPASGKRPAAITAAPQQRKQRAETSAAPQLHGINATSCGTTDVTSPIPTAAAQRAAEDQQQQQATQTTAAAMHVRDPAVAQCLAKYSVDASQHTQCCTQWHHLATCPPGHLGPLTEVIRREANHARLSKLTQEISNLPSQPTPAANTPPQPPIHPMPPPRSPQQAQHRPSNEARQQEQQSQEQIEATLTKRLASECIDNMPQEWQQGLLSSGRTAQPRTSIAVRIRIAKSLLARKSSQTIRGAIKALAYYTSFCTDNQMPSYPAATDTVAWALEEYDTGATTRATTRAANRKLQKKTARRNDRGGACATKPIRIGLRVFETLGCDVDGSSDLVKEISAAGPGIVNIFHFVLTRIGVSSLWIDYVPSDSNISDIPSRFHEMSPEEIASYSSILGTSVPMIIPQFADENGDWLSMVSIAQTIYH